MTLATNSLSAPPSPSKESKSATLGPATIRSSSRPPIIHPSSSTQEFRGHVSSVPRGVSSPAVSLPVGSRQAVLRHMHYTHHIKKVGHFSECSAQKWFYISYLVQDEEDDSSEDGNEEMNLMETDFCDWCCKYFANSLMKVCVCVCVCVLSEREKERERERGYPSVYPGV